uniref:Uncharacterized protein n=1 Tax=Candidatus Kentrum sp. LFY TaxID=2126342 RepID=A0A450V9D8_9GAMM|nr:MAG: hypothetical protein BECKLFY1418A_GA0070994_11429 [Candidatus Kentron sp. LFY]
MNTLEQRYLEILLNMDRSNYEEQAWEKQLRGDIESEIISTQENDTYLQKKLSDEEKEKAKKFFLHKEPIKEKARNRYHAEYLGFRQLLRQYSEEIKDAAKEYGFQFPYEVLPGVYPTTSINAQAVAMGGGALVLLNTGLMGFIYQMVKIYMFTRDFKSDDHVYGTEFSEEQGIESSAEVIVAYLFGGNSSLATRYPARGDFRGVAIQQLFYSAERFVLAHEYGHVLVGHLNPKNTVSRSLAAGDTMNFFKKSWEQEFEADAFALLLTFPPSMRQINTKDELELLDLRLAAPYIFFSLAILLDTVSQQLLSLPHTDFADDHPPSGERLRRLEKQLISMNAGRVIRAGQSFESWIETLSSPIISYIQEITQTKHHGVAESPCPVQKEAGRSHRLKPIFEYSENGEFWFDIAKVADDWFNLSHPGKDVGSKYWDKNGFRTSRDIVDFVLEHIGATLSVHVPSNLGIKLTQILDQGSDMTHFTICVSRTDVTVYYWPGDNRDSSFLCEKVKNWDTKRYKIIL